MDLPELLTPDPRAGPSLPAASNTGDEAKNMTDTLVHGGLRAEFVYHKLRGPMTRRDLGEGVQLRISGG